MEGLKDIHLHTPTETVLEAMEQAGFQLKGTFHFHYPESRLTWYQEIKKEIFEKDNKLYYFAGVTEWEGEKISVIRIGTVKNKCDNNKEYMSS
ncbi:sporulation protein [Alkalihalobacillus oceani]|uniref:Sporulation protein n=1 Tax=Halalkalibacter oceani TaxID=1653776 RepID=A0A9X2DS56_9BACI|nr:sporulation protein [Halalkalibacter oceani]MCM3716049.1 sporulation protein [Halalkalibacter oceani]